MILLTMTAVESPMLLDKSCLENFCVHMLFGMRIFIQLNDISPGVGLAFSTNSLGDVIVAKLYSFITVIDMAQTMQTLMFGIFIYYIMMHFHDWEYLRPRKVFGITVAVT